MIGDFGANRKKIQKALYDLSIIEKIEENEYSIRELKSSTLKELKIKNIPISTSEYGENAFWVINLEHAQNIFSAPQGFKTTEQILLFFTCNRLYVIMSEMKSTLQPFDHSSGIRAIFQKVKDTISRFNTLLPFFVFDEKYNSLEGIRYVAMIAYNQDNLTPALTNQDNFNADEKDMIKVFNGVKPEIFIQPEFGKTCPVTFKFIKNPNSKNSLESIDVSLDEIFSDEISDFDFSTAEYNEFHWPRQK